MENLVILDFSKLTFFVSCVGEDGGDLEELETERKTQGRTQEEGNMKRNKQNLFIQGLH